MLFLKQKTTDAFVAEPVNPTDAIRSISSVSFSLVIQGIYKTALCFDNIKKEIVGVKKGGLASCYIVTNPKDAKGRKRAFQGVVGVEAWAVWAYYKMAKISRHLEQFGAKRIVNIHFMNSY